jgi:YggT family protein
MIILQNLLSAVAEILDILLNLYFWIVIISALLSWVRPDPYNPVVRTLTALTEPVYYRIRKLLPFTYTSGMDFSPVIVLLLIKLLQLFVVKSLYSFAYGLV